VQLYDALGRRVSGRTEAYFRMVGNVAMTKARSYGQVSGFRDGGITTYEWSATMDEATCPICAFLDGQKFPVQEAVDRFARSDAAPDPDAAVADMQFYRVKGDLISVRGSNTPVARFTQERGELPTNFQTVTPVQGTEGMQVPPAHEGCRCTLLAVL
jgi:SPP1 gp7 family putative phage head morphogenesis protein